MEQSERNLAKLVVPRYQATQQIRRQLSRLQDIRRETPKTVFSIRPRLRRLDLWQKYTYEMLRRLFSNDELAREFASVPQPKITLPMRLSEESLKLKPYVYNLQKQLTSILDRLDLYPEPQLDLQADERTNAINIVERLATRFHLFASQLASRRRDRQAFLISDEFDLQDLFHALLMLFFDDVRPEEYTPSYAARSSKIDFILKPEQIAVELKMAGPKLRGKEVGDQLIIDIDRYRSHPDCQTLVCFVYDPKRLIDNPVGLERDLSRIEHNFHVKVVISPKQ